MKLREVIIAIFIFVAVFATIQFTIGAYKVEMNSMYPTFSGGPSPLPQDCIMVDKLTYRFRGPHRGEVVILWPPVSTENPFIKRVIGLPGETIKIEDGLVYIKKKGSDRFLLLDEKPDMPRCRNNGTWVIPKGHYFVLGDNRGDSSDSSYWGTVQRSKIIGKTWLRYWPLSRFGLTPHYSFKLIAPTEPASASFSTLPGAEPVILHASSS